MKPPTDGYNGSRGDVISVDVFTDQGYPLSNSCQTKKQEKRKKNKENKKEKRKKREEWRRREAKKLHTLVGSSR